MTLHKVLFVPSSKFNLVSIHCLAAYLKGVASFNSSSCLMQGPSLKSPLEIGRARRVLCYLFAGCHNCSPSCCSSSTPQILPVLSSSTYSSLPSLASSRSECSSSLSSLSVLNKQDVAIYSTSLVRSTSPRNKLVRNPNPSYFSDSMFVFS